MKALSKILLLLISISLNFGSYAQTNATAAIDTNSILIGDQINFELTFTCPEDYQVSWPDLKDTIISAIEILEKAKIDTSFSKDNTSMTFRQSLKVICWDSGYYAIPPIRFSYKVVGDTTARFAETEALLLEVKNVQVSMEKDFRDIKSPMEAPYTLREAIPWILGTLLLIAIGVGIFYYLKKRKKEEPFFKVPSKPKLPAHRIAFDALEELRREKLWQANRIKEYHTKLTDIARDYIFNKFNIHALELTSDEIMDALNVTPTNNDAKEKVRQTLLLADLVKFAKQNPLPLEHDTSLNNVVDFVKETIHVGETLASLEIHEEEPEKSATENNDTLVLIEKKGGSDVQ